VATVQLAQVIEALAAAHHLLFLKPQSAEAVDLIEMPVD
jgi:hypothetical protein